MSAGHPAELELGHEDLRARLKGLEVDQAALAARYGIDGRRPADAADPAEVRRRLEAMVYMVLSVRRSVGPASEALGWFPAARVEGMLGHIERVCRSSLDLGYHLATFAPEVLHHLHDEEIGEWIAELLDTYDRQGSQGCIRAMRAAGERAQALCRERSGVAFSGVALVLESFTAGLAGRRLKLAPGDALYCDTEVLHLPALVADFPARDENFRLYKAMIAQLWAEAWFGTWQGAVDAGGMADWLRQLVAEPRLLAAYQAAEGLRLDACLARELPGLWREMQCLAPAPLLAEPWRQAAEALRAPQADASWSRRLAAELLAAGHTQPALRPWQGELRPQAVAEVAAARIQRERAALQQALAVIADELGGNLRATGQGRPRFEVHAEPDDDWPGGIAFQLVLGDQAIRPQADAKQLMHSIVQDFGQIPPE